MLNGKFVAHIKTKAWIFNNIFAEQLKPFKNDSVLAANHIIFLAQSRLSSLDFNDDEILKIIRALNIYPSKHHIFPKTSWSVRNLNLPRCLQDVFVRPFPKTSWRRTCEKPTLRRLQEDVLNYALTTSSRRLGKTKKCYAEDVFKTFSWHFQYVLTKTNVCWDKVLGYDDVSSALCCMRK